MERSLLPPNPVTNCDFVESKSLAGKGLDEPERKKAMVAKKGKTTKRRKDLGARKVTSAQAKRIKGGATQFGSGGHVGGGSGVGKVKGWIDIYP